MKDVLHEDVQAWLERLGKARPTDLPIAWAIVDFWMENADGIHAGSAQGSSIQALIKDNSDQPYGVIGLWPHGSKSATVNLNFVKPAPGPAKKLRRHPVFDKKKKRKQVVDLFKDNTEIDFEFTPKQEVPLEGFPKLELDKLAEHEALVRFLHACETLFDICRSARKSSSST